MRAAQRLMNAAREMRGFASGMTPEQLAFSKAYRGDETHGDDRFRTRTSSGTANEVRSGRCSSPDAGTLAGFVSAPAESVSEEISATNSLSQVSSSQPAEPAGEVFILQAQASPATPLNPRPMIYRGSSLTDGQTASAGDTAASLSYSGA
jgi:hypothetical protein